MWRQTWAEVDLQCLRHNLSVIRAQVGPRVQIMASVKANAYGHGAIKVSRELLAAGADRLGVASIEEGIELREAGVAAPILCYGALPAGAEEEAVHHGIAVIVMDEAELERLSAAALRLGRPCAVHVKVDTGMNRLGVRGRAAALSLIRAAAGAGAGGAAAGAMAALAGVWLEGVCTHFSSADEPLRLIGGETERQAAEFNAIVSAARAEGIDTGLVHAANSAAIFRSNAYHYDMVRPGIALYGYHPFSAGELPGTELRPVLSLYTRIARLARLEVGEAVSYGRTFVCERPEEIATLPVGYADGVPRLLSGKMPVRVRGRAAHIAGRICMDQMMAVVTGLGADAGDVVQVYGESATDGVASIELAAAEMGTISYELLCAISARVPRVYVGGSAGG